MNLEIVLGDMYDAPAYSEEDLMKLLCGNIDEISKITQEEFMKYVKEAIIEVCKRKNCEYDPEFKKVENV